ncbi:hypothetical protein [Paraburkholderia piptadeniae]|nr:hypothetical protein [Paraburkholderia piptadeniae]
MSAEMSPGPDQWNDSLERVEPSADAFGTPLRGFGLDLFRTLKCSFQVGNDEIN